MYIENCKMILCDLSFSRPNCFIEYGYAFAKNKKIILCIEEKQGKEEDGSMKVAFDTLTQRYSFWQEEWLERRNKKKLNEYKKS